MSKGDIDKILGRVKPTASKTPAELMVALVEVQIAQVYATIELVEEIEALRAELKKR